MNNVQDDYFLLISTKYDPHALIVLSQLLLIERVLSYYSDVEFTLVVINIYGWVSFKDIDSLQTIIFMYDTILYKLFVMKMSNGEVHHM